MRGELVAIDLETTGLDVNKDRIIEIGAVRMQAGEVLKEYSTLINPGMDIPERTTALTGIAQSDVEKAPTINDVLTDLMKFVGDAPIIGHSVSFDMAFMNKHGLFINHTALDTYDLASVLMPHAPRYNLHSLTNTAGIELEDAHRALDDARASGLLYWELYLRALMLPLTTLETIVGAAQGIDWYARPTFAAALDEKRGQISPGAENDSTYPTRAGTVDHLVPLQPNDEIILLETDHISGIFQRGGNLAQAMPNFEYRQQQEQMATLITEAFNNSEHLMVEAGTGTGKSMAYLVPAFEWAALNNERVVISTDTIALQDQLLNKDIPALQNALGVNLNAAVLKGRTNYLCPLRLEEMKRRGPTNIEELRVLAKILVWQLETESGDKTEISLRGGAENSIWTRLSAAEGQGCRSNACRDELGIDCPFYKAFKQAEAAHLLIVNHALLVSDAKADNRVLPPYDYIIIDEGHHLEDAVTNSASFVIDESALIRRLEDLGDQRRGLLADLITALKNSDVPVKKVNRIETYVANVNEAADNMRVHVKGLFKAIYSLADSLTNLNQGDFTATVRIDENARTKPAFGGAYQHWNILSQFMEVISDATTELSDVIGRFESYQIDHYADLLRNTQNVARYLQETHTNLKGFFESPDPNTIYWIAVPADGQRVGLNTAPLHVGPIIADSLWLNRRSVVMTSATLRTGNSFEYIQERTFAENVKTHEVGSPFDYKSSTLLYLPDDMPDPSKSFYQYQKSVEGVILELARALGGRVMALFTSYGQLRQTSRSIGDALAAHGITVYDQSDGTSRQALLEGFKTTDKAVLMGTRSFWEGIDVPGESLSALVITRLPFPVPSDPIFAARSETYNDHFNEYAVPEAILRFRQGFGRLIRTRTDRGVVVVLDSRIITRRYGAAFLDSLPECTIKQASIADLPNAAKNWLARS